MNFKGEFHISKCKNGSLLLSPLLIYYCYINNIYCCWPYVKSRDIISSGGGGMLNETSTHVLKFCPYNYYNKIYLR